MFFNESLFFAHVFVVIGLVFLGVRFGKNALISLVVLQAVFANLFVVKQMSLFGFSVTCSDVFAVGGILAMNLLQEYYGKAEANKALYASFLGLVFFIVMSKFHLGYEPLGTDQTHAAFSQILSNATRISLASIGVYFVVQKLDLRLFGFLQNFFKGKRLALRVALSLGVTQLLDTVLFTFFGLYGIVSSVFDVIFVSFLVKLLIISCSSLLVLLAKRRIKNVPV